MRITDAGNVGIGTASPTVALHVRKGAAGFASYSGSGIFLENAGAAAYYEAACAALGDSCGYLFSSGSSLTSYIIDLSNNLSFVALGATRIQSFITNGAERMRITATGNVGIGTTSPPALLSVAGTLAGSLVAATIANLNAATGSSAALGFALGNVGTTATGSIANTLEGSSQAGLAFSTYNSGLGERMRITGAGNVGIGTATPGYPLHIRATNATDGIRIDAPSSSLIIGGGDGGTALYNVPNAGWGHAFQVNGAYKLVVTSAGNVGVAMQYPQHLFQVNGDDAAKSTTNTWTVTSDSRIKRNVRDLVGGLEIVKRVRPIEAEYNGLAGLPEGLRVVGFLADEMQHILPGTVTTSRQKLRETDAEEIDLLNLNIHELLIHTILAVKQLAAMIENQPAN
jgi:hypothetical protein